MNAENSEWGDFYHSGTSKAQAVSLSFFLSGFALARSLFERCLHLCKPHYLSLYTFFVLLSLWVCTNGVWCIFALIWYLFLHICFIFAFAFFEFRNFAHWIPNFELFVCKWFGFFVLFTNVLSHPFAISSYIPHLHMSLDSRFVFGSVFFTCHILPTNIHKYIINNEYFYYIPMLCKQQTQCFVFCQLLPFLQNEFLFYFFFFSFFCKFLWNFSLLTRITPITNFMSHYAVQLFNLFQFSTSRTILSRKLWCIYLHFIRFASFPLFILCLLFCALFLCMCVLLFCFFIRSFIHSFFLLFHFFYFICRSYFQLFVA